VTARELSSAEILEESIAGRGVSKCQILRIGRVKIGEKVSVRKVQQSGCIIRHFVEGTGDEEMRQVIAVITLMEGLHAQ
jgi:hypothetical protein